MHQIYSVCMCIKYVSRCPSILKELIDTHTYICVCVYIYVYVCIASSACAGCAAKQ